MFLFSFFKPPSWSLLVHISYLLCVVQASDSTTTLILFPFWISFFFFAVKKSRNNYTHPMSLSHPVSLIVLQTIYRACLHKRYTDEFVIFCGFLRSLVLHPRNQYFFHRYNLFASSSSAERPCALQTFCLANTHQSRQIRNLVLRFTWSNIFRLLLLLVQKKKKEFWSFSNSLWNAWRHKCMFSSIPYASWHRSISFVMVLETFPRISSNSYLFPSSSCSP